MKRARFILLVALLLASSAPARAGAELVLQDGQVLKGEDVRRAPDGTYELILESGQTLSLPQELVAEVRLTGEKRPPSGLVKAEPQQLAGNQPVKGAPTELLNSEPQQLAGEPVQAPRTADQLAVFGEPSKFQKGVVDNEWQPSSDWSNDQRQNNFAPSHWSKSVVDSDWEPTSAYDANRDVLADSQSRFQSGIDNSWTPTDGFSKKKTSFTRTAGGVRPTHGTGTAGRAVMTSYSTGSVSSVSRSRPSIYARTPTFSGGNGPRYRVFSGLSLTPRTGRSGPAECADEIFDALGDEGAEVAVEPLSGERYALLPIALYEGTATLSDRTHRAVFTIDGGVCRLISGDLQALLGVEFSDELAVARGATAYDTALGNNQPALPRAEDKIDYAFAVSALLDPSVVGNDSEFVLLRSDDDLKTVGVDDPSTCELSSKKRKKQAKQASGKIAAPRVVGATGDEIVTLVTWSGAGGRIVEHTVHLSADGKVSVSRELLAEHVGDHHDLRTLASN